MSGIDPDVAALARGLSEARVDGTDLAVGVGREPWCTRGGEHCDGDGGQLDWVEIVRGKRLKPDRVSACDSYTPREARKNDELTTLRRPGRQTCESDDTVRRWIDDWGAAGGP